MVLQESLAYFKPVLQRNTSLNETDRHCLRSDFHLAVKLFFKAHRGIQVVSTCDTEHSRIVALNQYKVRNNISQAAKLGEVSNLKKNHSKIFKRKCHPLYLQNI